MAITQMYGLHVVWPTSMRITPPIRCVGVCRRVLQLVAEVDILDVKASKQSQLLLLITTVAIGGIGGVGLAKMFQKQVKVENKIQTILNIFVSFLWKSLNLSPNASTLELTQKELSMVILNENNLLFMVMDSAYIYIYSSMQ